MKKHELIKKAYDDYAKGTIATWGFENKTLSGIYEYRTDGSIFDAEINFLVWNGAYWATIVTEPAKEAVKVENEWEFKKLMEYYESKCWKSKLGRSPLSFNFDDLIYSTHVAFFNDFVFPNRESYSASDVLDKAYTLFNLDHYTIIPFQDFAKREGIETRKPLITSVDGVDLFEGDYCYIAVKKTGNWFIDEHDDYNVFNRQAFWVTDNGKFFNDENQKVFSKSNAMCDWISKQPVTIQLSDGTATLNKSIGFVVLTQNRLDFDDVHKIWEAVNA